MMSLSDYYSEGMAGHKAANKSDREYPQTTLILSCIFSIILSLCLGFLTGLCVSRKYSKGRQGDCGHHYLEAQMLERQTTKAMVENGLYEPPYTTISTHSTTKNNLLSNQPVVSKDTMKTSLTVTNSTLGGTLGKCKKVYL